MIDLATVERLQPATAGDAARLLRDASDRGLAVVIAGRGSKQAWGAPALRTDRLLSTAGLREPIEHFAGDLIVTAPAGATLGEVNSVLARQGQWLPLDPWAGEQSTIGGMLATNDSGPRRQRYGAPRDLVIGIEFALVDGRLAKAGGRVVKNVAGYDLGRLLCGSFGTLALITAATFKLAPIPAASRTVALEGRDWPALAPVLHALTLSPLTPSAVEISGPGARILVRFESTATAADEMAAAVGTLAVSHGVRATVLQGAAEADCWTGHHTRLPADPAALTLARVSVLPSLLPTTIARAEAQALATGVTSRITGRALLGTLMLELSGEADAVAACITDLRQGLATAAGGHLDILSAPAGVTARVVRWSEVGPAAGVMRAVKAQFDPNGTLCPGGGPGGLA